jgi:hypothetical protein
VDLVAAGFGDLPDRYAVNRDTSTDAEQPGAAGSASVGSEAAHNLLGSFLEGRGQIGVYLLNWLAR